MTSARFTYDGGRFPQVNTRAERNAQAARLEKEAEQKRKAKKAAEMALRPVAGQTVKIVDSTANVFTQSYVGKTGKLVKENKTNFDHPFQVRFSDGKEFWFREKEVALADGGSSAGSSAAHAAAAAEDEDAAREDEEAEAEAGAEECAGGRFDGMARGEVGCRA